VTKKKSLKRGLLFSRDSTDIAKFLFIRFVPYGTRILSMLGISVLKPKETKFFYEVVYGIKLSLLSMTGE
jgi:hypothetical protein